MDDKLRYSNLYEMEGMSAAESHIHGQRVGLLLAVRDLGIETDGTEGFNKLFEKLVEAGYHVLLDIVKAEV